MSYTTPEKPPAIHASVCAIIGALAERGIAKSKKNQQQGYHFRGIDDVYAALSPLLAQHHVAVYPYVEDRTVTERETKNGGVLFYVVCRVRFTLVSALDGSKVETVVVGEAMDSADKATNKAMSAAYKYFALLTFSPPVEGQDDADFQTHEVVAAVPPAKKQAIAFDLVEEATAAIAAAKTRADLFSVADRIGASKFSGTDREMARETWKRRMAEVVT